MSAGTHKHDRHLQELQLNCLVFSRKLSEFMEEHENQFALLRNREVIDFFRTFDEAQAVGDRLYTDGLYSIQEVSERTIEGPYVTIRFDRRGIPVG